MASREGGGRGGRKTGSRRPSHGHSSTPSPPSASSVLALQRGLTGERTLVGTAYMDDPALLAAYRSYYWHVSFAQATRALDTAGLRPTAVLDMGAGPGPMAAAAFARGASRLALVDASAKALDAAREELARLACERGAAPPALETRVSDLERFDPPELAPVDLVVFGHSLNEVASGEPDAIDRRAALVMRMARLLAPGGAALVIDPATLASSRQTLAVRDRLLREGWSIAAPCVYEGPCPALAAGPSHTCHDEASWAAPASVMKTAEALGLDRALIKMTWFAARPPAGEARKPETPRLYRVVSEPMLNKAGRVRYILCGPGGRLAFSARKDAAGAAAAGFFALRRFDLVALENAERREGGLGFLPSTVIRRG